MQLWCIRCNSRKCILKKSINERDLIAMKSWWLAHTFADLLMIYSPCNQYICENSHVDKMQIDEHLYYYVNINVCKQSTEVGVSLCESWLVEFIIQLSTCGLGLRKVNKRHNVAVIMTGKHLFLVSRLEFDLGS